ASPVVVLNKIDVSPSVDEVLDEIEGLAFSVPIVAMSAVDRRGLEALARHLEPKKTLALLGSSGVGKSTIINVLLGREAQSTQAVRADDDRGRHTTTHRQLFVLSSGALLIDTPGMRELQLWGDEAGVEAAFADIERLAEACAFRDCSHTVEPECAVHAAVESGVLEEARFESFLKLRRELRHLEARYDERLRREDKRRAKQLCKEAS